MIFVVEQSQKGPKKILGIGGGGDHIHLYSKSQHVTSLHHRPFFLNDYKIYYYNTSCLFIHY